MRLQPNEPNYVGPLRRIVVGLIIFIFFLIFILWRIDGVRVERIRMALLDQFVPRMEWASAPVSYVVKMGQDFRSYARIHEQNQELRLELQKMQAWKEAAIQLEQENAKLLNLSNLRKGAAQTYISGVVLADSGSQFRQSVLVNLGTNDGVQEGWIALDGLGVVGRVVNTGKNTSRVMLLSDPVSRMPVILQPTGQRALLIGNGSATPALEFLGRAEEIRPGDKVVTSGRGGVFPAGLLVGQVVRAASGKLRVLLAANYESLDFLRIQRSAGLEILNDPTDLILPPGMKME